MQYVYIAQLLIMIVGPLVKMVLRVGADRKLTHPAD